MCKNILRTRKSASHLLRIATILVLPTLFICLITLELGLRTIGRTPSNTTDGIFEKYESSYRLKKNISKISKTPSYSCTIHTNSFGFRDKTSATRTIGQKPYYLFLGESLTFGNGLDYGQTFMGLFGQLMENHGIDVFNLAVGGHRLSDQEELLHDFTHSLSQKPSYVIICFSPLFVEGFDQTYTDIVIKNGYIFEKSNWILPYIRITLGNTSAAYCFFRDNIRRIQMRFSNHQLAVARQSLSFYSINNRLTTPSMQKSLEMSLNNIDSMIIGLGATPIYVYLPLSTDFILDDLVRQMGENPNNYDMFCYYKLLLKHCDKQQIHLINLSPGLKKLYEQGLPLNFILDAHYNANANQVIFEELLQSMMEHGLITQESGLDHHE